MKKYISILLITLGLPLTVMAQDTLIMGLACQVLKDNVKKEMRYFYLIDSSFTAKIDKYDFREIKMNHRQLTDSDLPIDIKVTDSTIINWCDYDFENAKCIAFQDLPKFPGYNWRRNILVSYSKYKDERVLDSLNNLKRNELYIPVKRFWTNKRIQKEISKAWERFESKFEKEEKDFIRLSTPVFSEDKKYALISIHNLGRGRSYIYKKLNGKWIKIADYDWWIA